MLKVDLGCNAPSRANPNIFLLSELQQGEAAQSVSVVSSDLTAPALTRPGPVLPRSRCFGTHTASSKATSASPSTAAASATSSAPGKPWSPDTDKSSAGRAGNNWLTEKILLSSSRTSKLPMVESGLGPRTLTGTVRGSNASLLFHDRFLALAFNPKVGREGVETPP